MKNMIKSVIVLSLICLVVAGALGATNYITKDKIKADTEMRTQEALKELISDAEAFEKLESIESLGLSKEISAVYLADGGAKGYVFEISTKGYSSGLVIMCAVSPEGEIIKTSTLSHSETPTIGGAKVVDNASYTDKFIGKDASSIDDGTDAVSGATVSSNAYKNAVKTALDAFGKIASIG